MENNNANTEQEVLDTNISYNTDIAKDNVNVKLFIDEVLVYENIK